MYVVQKEMLAEFQLSFRIAVTMKAVYCWLENVTSKTLHNFVYTNHIMLYHIKPFGVSEKNCYLTAG